MLLQPKAKEDMVEATPLSTEKDKREKGES